MSPFRQIALHVGFALVSGLLAAPAVAQTTQGSASRAQASKLWIVAGGASTTVRGDCQTCEEEFDYRHTGSIFGDFGVRVNDRMDAGVELFWTGMDTASGQLRATRIDAVAQFRPWSSSGFFIKGGAGMAFIRNWVDVLGPDASNSKALSVVIGAGWEFRPTARVGWQIFGVQHAAALGDLQMSDGDKPDVMGNSWSLGAALVIR